MINAEKNSRYNGCIYCTWWAGTKKVKPIWILLKQERLSGSGITWAVCKSAPRSREITTPAPNHSVFLQAGCLSCRRTNSVNALSEGKPPASGTYKTLTQYSQHIQLCYRSTHTCSITVWKRTLTRLLTSDVSSCAVYQWDGDEAAGRLGRILLNIDFRLMPELASTAAWDTNRQISCTISSDITTIFLLNLPIL